jgi:hypothetical protein
MPGNHAAGNGGPRYWPRVRPVTDTRTADSALLLATCRQCRNWIGYLCSSAAQGQPPELVRAMALRRLLALPQQHTLHGPGSTTDTAEPREEPLT